MGNWVWHQIFAGIAGCRYGAWSSQTLFPHHLMDFLLSSRLWDPFITNIAYSDVCFSGDWNKFFLLNIILDVTKKKLKITLFLYFLWNVKFSKDNFAFQTWASRLQHKKNMRPSNPSESIAHNTWNPRVNWIIPFSLSFTNLDLIFLFFLLNHSNEFNYWILLDIIY